MGIENGSSSQTIESRLRRGYDAMTELCQGNLGALVASSQAAICGVQDVNAALLAFAQSRAKGCVEAGQQLAACRSVEDALEVQLEHAKAALQAWTYEFERLNALHGRLVAEVMAPLKGRAAVAAKGGAKIGEDTAAESGAEALAA